MNSSTLPLTSALDRGGWLTPRLGPFTPRGSNTVRFVQKTVLSPGPVWTGDENIATGIRSPDGPARAI